MPRSSPNFWPDILSNHLSWGTEYGYVIVFENLLCMASLKGFWQGPCEVLRPILPGTYRVYIRGGEEILTSRQLKPHVPYKENKKVSLHYYTDREG